MARFQNRPFRFRNLNRLRKVIGVLAKYGFDDVVAHTQLHKIIPRRRLTSLKKEGKKIVAQNRYERIRLAFEELGPTFIKLGQILSNRHDLLPKELTKEFEKLQDDVSTDFELDVFAEIKNRLGINPDDEFKEIKTEPEASASIAQVHRAQLKNGEWVVLKIQRPGIRDMIEADIEIVRYIFRMLEKRIPEIAVYKPLDLLDAFEKSIMTELNFVTEANSVQRFRSNFKDDERIYVPKVYRQYSNDTVLCMEEVLGTKTSDLEALKKREIDIDKIVEIGVDAYFKQVFKHGYFHADPHPGNFVVTNDERVCFLDFGMMGSILPRDKEVFGEMVVNFIRKDVRRLIINIEDISGKSILEERKSLEYDLYDMIQEVSSTSLQDMNMEMLYEKIHGFIYRHKIAIPSDLFLLMRAFVVMEGMGLRLKPDFNLMEAMEPYAKKLILQKYHPKTVINSFWETFLDARDLMKGLPEDTKKILENVKEGKLKIAFVHQGLEGFYQSMDRDTNRLSLAVITAALIIGSSLVVHSGIPPLILNIPIIGFIGFSLSMILGIWIVISILRKNKI
jgi:ubiquinone biosynthesis protein